MSLSPPDLRPDETRLRQFGWIAAVALGLLGGLVVLRGGPLPPAAAAWAVGAASGAASRLLPRANLPLYLLLSVVTWPVGVVVSHAALAVVFFGLVTPVALVARLLGRDRLGLRREPDAGSHWQEREPPGDSSRYFRQY